MDISVAQAKETIDNYNTENEFKNYRYEGYIKKGGTLNDLTKRIEEQLKKQENVDPDEAGYKFMVLADPKASGGNNLSIHATKLANINELSVAVAIAKTKRFKEREKELNKLLILEKEDIKKIDDTSLTGAMEKKILQGGAMADYICSSYTDIIDVDWTNTPARFKKFTEAEHNNNPADIVIKGSDANPYLGISLKASFGKNDIGQYNSSVCVFSNGILPIHEEGGNIVFPNGPDGKWKGLSEECKGCTPSDKNARGHHIQNECNKKKEDFYDDAANRLIDGWEGAKTTAEKKTSYKKYIDPVPENEDWEENLKKIEEERCKLCDQCRDIYFQELKPGVTDNKVTLDFPLEVVELIFSNYLRINTTKSGIPYTKVSALGDIVKEDGDDGDLLKKYIPEGDKKTRTLIFQKKGSGTISIECEGAHIGVNFRIKFSGTPPSSFKIDGTNFKCSGASTDVNEGGGPSLITRSEPSSEALEGINDNFIKISDPDELAILYEIIDFYLQDTDNIEEMVEKIETELNEDADVVNIIKLYKKIYENAYPDPITQRDRRAFTRNIIKGLVSSGGEPLQGLKEEFIRILNIYIDENNEYLVNQKLEEHDNNSCGVASAEPEPEPEPEPLLLGKGGGQKIRRNTRRRNTRRRNTRRRNTRKNTRRRNTRRNTRRRNNKKKGKTRRRRGK